MEELMKIQIVLSNLAKAVQRLQNEKERDTLQKPLYDLMEVLNNLIQEYET